MKAFPVFHYSLLFLCVSLCCPDEMEPVVIEIENQDLISVKNDQINFKKNDTIFIETFIDNIQISIENKEIDLRQIANPDLYSGDSFQYQLALFKETEFGTFAKIPLTEDAVIINEGNVEILQEEIYVQALYNQSGFSSKMGIKLLEPGTFYLAGANYTRDFNDEPIYIYSLFSSAEQIIITTSISNQELLPGYKIQVFD